MSVLRRVLGIAALAIATIVLVVRIERINRENPMQLAPRTLHLLYIDSLRAELLTFAEQYGRPVFYYDTTPPVTGHGRIQLGRLRQALFDPRIEYTYGDGGFTIDWRSDPKPRRPPGDWVAFGSGRPHQWWNTPWPASAAQYAEIRRIAITPQWPDRPRVPRARRAPDPTPRNDATYAFLSLAATH